MPEDRAKLFAPGQETLQRVIARECGGADKDRSQRERRQRVEARLSETAELCEMIKRACLEHDHRDQKEFHREGGEWKLAPAQ